MSHTIYWILASIACRKRNVTMERWHLLLSCSHSQLSLSRFIFLFCMLFCPSVSLFLSSFACVCVFVCLHFSLYGHFSFSSASPKIRFFLVLNLKLNISKIAWKLGSSQIHCYYRNFSAKLSDFIFGWKFCNQRICSSSISLCIVLIWCQKKIIYYNLFMMIWKFVLLSVCS